MLAKDVTIRGFATGSWAAAPVAAQSPAERIDDIQQSLDKLRAELGLTDKAPGLSQLQSLRVVSLIDADVDARSVLTTTERQLLSSVRKELRNSLPTINFLPSTVALSDTESELLVTVKVRRGTFPGVAQTVYTYSVSFEVREGVARIRRFTTTAPSDDLEKQKAIVDELNAERGKRIRATVWHSARAAVVLPNQLSSEVTASVRGLSEELADAILQAQ